MQINNQNGLMVNGENRVVFRNGKRIQIPAHIKINTIANIDGKVYIGGWELMKDNTWKRSLKAMWYRFF